ncbi:hypothetical protein QUW15_10645 [Desulfovibrio piger]|nr:hypothetical protein [Desulfovibrio piger]
MTQRKLPPQKTKPRFSQRPPGRKKASPTGEQRPGKKSESRGLRRHTIPKNREFILEHFQFETLRVSNHTACRFAEKTRFFRSLLAGRRCAAASRFTFFKVETLYVIEFHKRICETLVQHQASWPCAETATRD